MVVLVLGVLQVVMVLPIISRRRGRREKTEGLSSSLLSFMNKTVQELFPLIGIAIHGPNCNLLPAVASLLVGGHYNSKAPRQERL